MSQKKYPGRQVIVSYDEMDVIKKRHEQYLAQYNAGPEECVIENMRPAHPFEQRQHGFKTNYEIRWNTGRGWQVYMSHTGIIVLNPDE